jgi:hypothetical protein
LKRSTFWKYGKWLFILVLAALVGCQPVGGLDLTKALLSGSETNSLQQSATISLHFELDPKQQPDERTQAMVGLLNDARLDLQEIKMENQETVSLKGQLALAVGAIPFHISINPDQMVMKVDGVNRTIVYPLSLDDLYGDDPAAKSIMDIINQVKEKKLDKKLESLLISNLPNLKDVNVNSVTETIHNESVGLYRVEAGLTGKDALPLVKSFIRNLTKDDKNVKQLISDLYDVLWPVVKPLIEQSGQTAELPDFSGALPDIPGASQLNDTADSLKKALINVGDDKELAVDILHTTFKELLYFGYIMAESFQNMNDPAIRSLFGDDLKVNTKLYFDRSLNLRKSDIDISIFPTGLESNDGIKGVTLKMQTESWDVNKPVKADMLEPGANPLLLNKGADPSELFKAIDPQSTVGKLMGQMSYAQGPTQTKGAEPKVQYIPIEDKAIVSSTAGYVDAAGNLFAPLPVLAMELADDVEVDGDDIYLSGAWVDVLQLTVGSDVAIVDGDEITLDGIVENINGTVYVPLEVAEYLGGFYWFEKEKGMIGIIIDD